MSAYMVCPICSESYDTKEEVDDCVRKHEEAGEIEIAEDEEKEE